MHIHVGQYCHCYQYLLPRTVSLLALYMSITAMIGTTNHQRTFAMGMAGLRGT